MDIISELQRKADAFIQDKPDSSAIALYTILFPGIPDENDFNWAREQVANIKAIANEESNQD
jgi:hypothetical protein